MFSTWITTPITTYDSNRTLVLTGSGAVYGLRGEMDTTEPALFEWLAHCLLATGYTDVVDARIRPVVEES